VKHSPPEAIQAAMTTLAEEAEREALRNLAGLH